MVKACCNCKHYMPKCSRCHEGFETWDDWIYWGGQECDLFEISKKSSDELRKYKLERING